MKRKLINLSVISKMFFFTFLLNFTQILKSERIFFSTDYSQSTLIAKKSLAENYFSSLYKDDFFGNEVEFINPILPQLVICGDAGRASIEIVKLANGRSISNTQLEIVLDEGLKYAYNYIVNIFISS